MCINVAVAEAGPFDQPIVREEGAALGFRSANQGFEMNFATLWRHLPTTKCSCFCLQRQRESCLKFAAQNIPLRRLGGVPVIYLRNRRTAKIRPMREAGKINLNIDRNLAINNWCDFLRPLSMGNGAALEHDFTYHRPIAVFVTLNPTSALVLKIKMKE